MAESPGLDLLGLLLRRWWVLLVVVVVGALAGFGGLQLVAPTYSTSATQLIKGVPGAGTGANFLAAQFCRGAGEVLPSLPLQLRGS